MDINTLTTRLGRGKLKRAYGRVVATTLPHPTRLADDFDRRLVMIMGPSGIEQLDGKCGFDIMLALGHTSQYICTELRKGKSFKLVVFKRPAKMRIATWRNVLLAAAEAYPEAADLISKHGRLVRKTPFAEFEAEAGFSFSEVHKIGTEDERYMTLARLLASDGSALAVRRFLYHTVRLTELFAGDGYTKTPGGHRGVREYIIANGPLTDLGSHEIIDLKVRSATCK